MRRAMLLSTCLLAGAAAAEAEEPLTFEAWQRQSSLVCVGDPALRLPTPDVRDAFGFTLTVDGATAKLTRTAASTHPGELRFGVLNGIKDLEPWTRAGLELFLARFEQADVDAILIGGDSAYGELELEDVFVFLGERTRRPVVLGIGNNESRAAFNRAATSAWRKHPQLLNGNLIRRFDLAGADVLTLGGYHDKAFVSASGSCLYPESAVTGLPALAAQADDPVVLLLHGPPKGDGKEAIDFVPGGGNVGDARLNGAITAAKIPYVIAGHILEGGGRATDGGGKRPVAAGKRSKALWLNPGQANGLPYEVNGGATGWGLAAILTIQKGEASYELLRAPKPAPAP